MKRLILIILILGLMQVIIGCASAVFPNLKGPPLNSPKPVLLPTTSTKEDDERKKITLAEKKAKLDEALKHAKVKKDDILNITWYNFLDMAEVDNNGIASYIGSRMVQNENVALLKIYVLYRNKNWVFFDKLYFKTDSNTYEISTTGKEKQTRVINGGVAEWYDIAADKKLYNMLIDIASSKKVIMRYSGKQDNVDRTVTDIEKQNIRWALDVFNGFDGILVDDKI